jgi:hypothetical protein
MSIRSLTLGSFFPRVKSETKTEVTKTVRRPTIITSRSFSTGHAAVRQSRRAKLTSFVPWLSAAACAGVIAVSGLYLFSINLYAAKGYDLKRQQAAVRELTAQQQQLIIKQAEIGSIAQLASQASADQLVQITDEEFIQPKQLSAR